MGLSVTAKRSPGGVRRRHFFRDMARETLVWCEEMCGMRHMKLSDIPNLPPQAFEALMPRVRPEVVIAPEDGQVRARVPGVKEAVLLFAAADASTLAMFNAFNGHQTVAQIARKLEGEMGWTPEQSMANVRALFLRLLELRVCVPGNDPAP
jgi:hypothetical protein